MCFGCTVLIERNFGPVWFGDCWCIDRNGRTRFLYSSYKHFLNLLGWQNELVRFCGVGERYFCGTLQADISITSLDQICSGIRSEKDRFLFQYIYSQIYAYIQDNPSVLEMLQKDKQMDLFSLYKIKTQKQQTVLMHGWSLLQSFTTLYSDAKSFSQEAFLDGSEEHEGMLMKLWNNLQPDSPLSARISEDWKTIGFQGRNPATDFRGMGLLGLHQLVEFSCSCDGKSLFYAFTHGNENYFPFAIAGINITNAIMTMPKRQLFVIYLRYYSRTSKMSESRRKQRFSFVDWLYEQLFHQLLLDWNNSDQNISNFNAILTKMISNF